MDSRTDAQHGDAAMTYQQKDDYKESEAWRQMLDRQYPDKNDPRRDPMFSSHNLDYAAARLLSAILDVLYEIRDKKS